MDYFCLELIINILIYNLLRCKLLLYYEPVGLLKEREYNYLKLQNLDNLIHIKNKLS